MNNFKYFVKNTAHMQFLMLYFCYLSPEGQLFAQSLTFLLCANLSLYINKDPPPPVAQK